MADGFLSRWSQRKQALRAGQMLEEPVIEPLDLRTNPASVDDAVGAVLPQEDKLPVLTLQDAQALTQQSGGAQCSHEEALFRPALSGDGSTRYLY